MDAFPSSFDSPTVEVPDEAANPCGAKCPVPAEKEELLDKNGGGHYCNSIESRLMASRGGCSSGVEAGGSSREDSEEELGVLLNLWSAVEVREGNIIDSGNAGLVQCPLCAADISDLSEEQRQLHTNDCLDKGEAHSQDVSFNYLSCFFFGVICNVNAMVSDDMGIRIGCSS